MKRTRMIVTILAASVMALGTAGTAWAHEPVPTADEQCGAQGEQTTAQNDDQACGPDEKGQTGDQGEKQDGQKGADEKGSTSTGQSGDQGAMQAGQQGNNEQQGDNQQEGDK